MRIWGLLTIFAALAFGQGAHAAVLTGSMTTDNSGQILFGVDYTVPADGLTYRWDFFTDSAHPNAIITLGAPNDVFQIDKIGNGNGTTHNVMSFVAPHFTWNEIYAPGHTTVFVSADPSYNVCSDATGAGVLCGATNNVFGDNAALGVNVKDIVHITFSATAIPEPAAWALMLTGVFGIGAVLRQRRRMAREAGPTLV